MQKTGTLTIDLGESKLDGEALARNGFPDPLGEATNFLQNRGFRTNERVRVTGDEGTIGTLQVFFITSADHLTATASFLDSGDVGAARKGRSKPPARAKSASKSRKKEVTKGTGTKRNAVVSTASKRGAKKRPARPAGGKQSTKKRK